MSDMDDAWFELNRTWWDERVAVHVGSDFYGVDRFLAGSTPLRGYEIEEAGDVAGLDLVHLQCHFGMDTLGWARLGARVVGRRPERAGDPGRPRARRARRARGRVRGGQRVRHADHSPWSNVRPRLHRDRRALLAPGHRRVGRASSTELLRPGGRLHLVEFHPVTHWCLGETDLTVKYSYFHEGPWVWDDDPDEPGSTTPIPTPPSSTTTPSSGTTASAPSSRRWPTAGMRIESLVERPTLLHAALAVHGGGGRPGLAHPAGAARRSRSASASSP